MPIQTNYSGIYAQQLTSSEASFANEVNQHLDAINSKASGSQLLEQISRLSSRRGHKLTIHELEASGHPITEPVLSRSQLENHANATSYRDIRETAGHRYALKKRFGSNEGSSAVISWAPRVSKIDVDSDGDATGHSQSSTDKVSTLAHELVHAKHIMGGTWKGSYDNPRDPDTNAGKEELRAVGLGKYKYSRSREPSENSVREEHGLPKRKSYHHSGYHSDSD